MQIFPAFPGMMMKKYFLRMCAVLSTTKPVCHPQHASWILSLMILFSQQFVETVLYLMASHQRGGMSLRVKGNEKMIRNIKNIYSVYLGPKYKLVVVSVWERKGGIYIYIIKGCCRLDHDALQAQF